MGTIEQIRQEYARRAETADCRRRQIQKEIARTSLLRLLLFAATVTGACLLRETWQAATTVAVGGIALFALLMQRHNRLFRQKAYQETHARINRDELDALDYRTDGRDGGNEFTDPQHLYTFDLDVFGEHSLFQALNRTCTAAGRIRLARLLDRQPDGRADILLRQEAVRELAPQLEFRQHFQTLGLMYPGEADDESRLTAWAEAPVQFRRRRALRLLPPAVTGINLLCLLLVLTGCLSATAWGTLWMVWLIAAIRFTARISKVQGQYGRQLQILNTYATLLREMEQLPADAPLLRRLQEQLGGKADASQAIHRLGRLMHELDQRNNYLMYALLNGTFCWELWQIMRIEAWKEQHASCLPRWMDALGQMDALCSLAAFAYNHPEYAYPTLLGSDDHPQPDAAGSAATAPFLLRATALGHPLMHRDRCVRNDLEIPSRPYFLIITGANMAGKSTYLRTIGINYLLACTGAPVCAQKMELTPVQLVTSLRTSDSLSSNESYFFAELKRLKLIIDLLQEGRQLFIILDEILKGTNSVDKQRGSLALVRQLMTLQANGIIATHDLMLGSLAEHFPRQIRNYRFEADICGDELTFSYRLRPGVAQNMNACFLMKKMGIAVTDDSQA